MSRQISISDVLKMFLAHIKLIIILTVVGGVLSYIYVSFFVTPVYTTSALVIVQNDSKFAYGDVQNPTTAAGGNSNVVNTSNISSSVALANTCTVLFTQDPDMKSIIGGNSVTIKAIEESYFLRITASSSDPGTAANVANKVAAAAPAVFAKYFGEAGKVDTVDEAAIPRAPSSPSVPRFVIIGLAIGLFLGLAIAFLLEVVDTTIKVNDDLYKMYDIPVFAEIIDFESEGGAKK
ncbi:MAG: hypothetical protein KBS62_05390 [Oscillospiraceae bacterium]|nr:hypothetical protein [Candidatus Ruminococcus equi]